MDRVMPAAGTVQKPSQAEPRSAMLGQLMKQGLEKLARLDGWIESRSWFAPLLIVVAGSLVTVPMAVFGFVYGDTIHLVWAKHFSDQLWAGNLYPRWLLDMNSGLGSPTFYFYGPVSYYITSLFFLVLPFHGYGWLQVGLSAALASVGSGLAAYVWLRQHSSASRRMHRRNAVHLAALPLARRSCGAFCVCRVLGVRVDAPESLLCDPVARGSPAKHCRTGGHVCAFY